VPADSRPGDEPFAARRRYSAYGSGPNGTKAVGTWGRSEGIMNDTSLVAVTGATGFLGSHLTERLVRDGHRVRILARDPAKAEALRRTVSGGIVLGDITDPSALAALVEGADTVFHLVSNFRTASGPPSSYRAVNLQGTVTALDAARAAGVRRFVHCSTIGVHGHVRATPGDEWSPYAPGDLYQETKMQAEQACFAEARRGGMEIVIVRPCSIYGPGDLRMLKMFKMLRNGRFFLLGPCRENFHAVYIDDLVEGFLLAMRTPDISGEAFIIGGPEYLPLREYLATAARAVGARPPALRFPYAPFYAAAAVCEAICVPLGLEPPLHRRRVRFFRNNRAFSIEKARAVLGYAPAVDLEEGMKRTVLWYRENGYLP